MNYSQKEEICRNSSQPLVSIGIPTYNRPDGLFRTLNYITRQTYRNLEIIISDNASPDGKTEKVAHDFMSIDQRLQYHRQQQNVGPFHNFKFVLEQATGEHFMWAADDDEWDPRFVEVCVRLLEKGAVSAMTGFDTHYRLSGLRYSNRLPLFLSSPSMAHNFYRFLYRPTPSLFYGLHRRSAIQFFVDETRWFDYYDCYFVLKMILQGPISIWPEVLYTAGIDATTYQIKPVKPASGLNLLPFLSATKHLISSHHFLPLDRLHINAALVFFGVRGYLWYLIQLIRKAMERKIQPSTGSLR